MVHVIAPDAAAHGPAMLSSLVPAGAGLIAAATVAGALLASRRRGDKEIWCAAAAGALLVIAGLHLLPDAWGGAYAVRLWPPLVPIAAMGAFTATGVAARTGCGCRPHTEQAGGAAAAAALALHRFLEGSAVAWAASATLVGALAVHAFAEGLAVGALLGAQPHRMAGWLAAMSVSPILGAVAAGAFPVPQATGPLLLALAAGVIAQAACVSLRAAFHGVRTRRLQLSHSAATVAVAAVVTALAVNMAG